MDGDSEIADLYKQVRLIAWSGAGYLRERMEDDNPSQPSGDDWRGSLRVGQLQSEPKPRSKSVGQPWASFTSR